MEQFYSGIDLGSRKSHICVIDEDNNKLVDMKVENDLSTIEGLLSPYKKGLRVVVESTFNWDWIVYGLQDRGYDVKRFECLRRAKPWGVNLKHSVIGSFSTLPLSM